MLVNACHMFVSAFQIHKLVNAFHMLVSALPILVSAFHQGYGVGGFWVESELGS